MVFNCLQHLGNWFPFFTCWQVLNANLPKPKDLSKGGQGGEVFYIFLNQYPFWGKKTQAASHLWSNLFLFSRTHNTRPSILPYQVSHRCFERQISLGAGIVDCPYGMVTYHIYSPDLWAEEIGTITILFLKPYVRLFSFHPVEGQPQ